MPNPFHAATPATPATRDPTLDLTPRCQPLIHILATCNLCGLDSTHLADPSRSRLYLPNGTDLVASVTRDANVVATLQSELDITDLEYFRAAFFCILACCL